MRQTRLTKRRNATHPTHLVLAVYVATRGPRPTMTFRAAVPRRGAAASLPAPVWTRTPTPLMRRRWRARTSGRWLAFDGFCRDLDGAGARRVDKWTVPTTRAVGSAPGRRQCPLRRGPSCADLCMFGGTKAKSIATPFHALALLPSKVSISTPCCSAPTAAEAGPHAQSEHIGVTPASVALSRTKKFGCRPRTARVLASRFRGRRRWG